jgi:hypothetical protein
MTKVDTSQLDFKASAKRLEGVAEHTPLMLNQNLTKK